MAPLPCLLSLPAELRNEIYTLVLADPTQKVHQITNQDFKSLPIPGLLQTSRQLRREASPIYYSAHQFDFWLQRPHHSLKSTDTPFTKPLLAWLHTISPYNLALIPSLRLTLAPKPSTTFPLDAPPTLRRPFPTLNHEPPANAHEAWLALFRFYRANGLDLGKLVLDIANHSCNGDAGVNAGRMLAGEYLKKFPFSRMMAFFGFAEAYREVEIEVEWAILMRSSRLMFGRG